MSWRRSAIKEVNDWFLEQQRETIMGKLQQAQNNVVRFAQPEVVMCRVAKSRVRILNFFPVRVRFAKHFQVRVRFGLEKKPRVRYLCTRHITISNSEFTFTNRTIFIPTNLFVVQSINTGYGINATWTWQWGNWGQIGELGHVRIHQAAVHTWSRSAVED